MPRDQEDRSVCIDDTGAGDADQAEEVVIARQAQFESRRTDPEVEQRPRVG
jgi:hypothetical protein